jgi:hypothetical protein
MFPRLIKVLAIPIHNLITSASFLYYNYAYCTFDRIVAMVGASFRRSNKRKEKANMAKLAK